MLKQILFYVIGLSVSLRQNTSHGGPLQAHHNNDYQCGRKLEDTPSLHGITEERLREIRSEFLYWFSDQDGTDGNGDYQENIFSSSPQIQKDFSFQLPFFGTHFNQTRISLNGYLEFSDPPQHYTYPLTFPNIKWPEENDPSFIGIFFSKMRIGNVHPEDQDKRKPGVYFRMENDLSARVDKFGIELRERLVWDIYEGVEESGNFIPKHALIVTWKNVSFSGGIDKSLDLTNTFQLVLATDEIDTYVIFNYADIQWTSHTEAGGDTFTGKGGISAFVGFNAGNGTQSYEYLPYSQSPAIQHLTDNGCGNGFPGRHIFRIEKKIVLGCCRLTESTTEADQEVTTSTNPPKPTGTPYIITAERLRQIRSELLYWFSDRGGSDGYGDYQKNIHSSSPQIQKYFSFQLPFFSFHFNHTRISLNGYLEFSDPSKYYTYYTYPLIFPNKRWPEENDPSFIGIFFSKMRIGNVHPEDKDKRRSGVYFRMENDLPTRIDQFGVELRERLVWDIHEGVQKSDSFLPKHALIVTWKNVSFSGGIDRSLGLTNTFQLVLATDEIDTYVIFNYADIQWTSHTEAGGDTSTGMGGIPAFVGFNAGNGTQSYEYLPYSQSPAIHHLTDHGCGNGFPGRHIFRIEEKIVLGSCRLTESTTEAEQEVITPTNPPKPTGAPYILTAERLRQIRSELLYWFSDEDGSDRFGEYQTDIRSSVPQILKKFNFKIPFFGSHFNYTKVSLNGYLEFTDPPQQFTYPLVFPNKDWPQENDPSFIGIFFSKTRLGNIHPDEKDQRKPGVYFRLETDLPTRTDQFGVELRERITSDIHEVIEGSHNFFPRHAVIVTWKNISFAGGIDKSRDKTNTFQLVLATDESKTYIIFNYADLKWTSHTEAGGDTLYGVGGYPAFVGFNAGNGKGSYEYLPYSQSPSIVHLVDQGCANGFPGRHIFRIDERIVAGTCKLSESTTEASLVTIAPSTTSTIENLYVLTEDRLKEIRGEFLYYFSDRDEIDGHGDYEEDIHSSSPQIQKNFSFQLPFFGSKFNYTMVSINGYLGFSDPPKYYTYPLVFPNKEWPKENDPSFIGIFFSKARIGHINPEDKDQRKPGVYIRLETNLQAPVDQFGAELRERLMLDIREGIQGSVNFVPKHAMIVTWKNISFAGGIDKSLYKTNTFQMVLTTDEVQTYVIFNYADLQWTTHTEAGGDTVTGEGGVPAFVGFNAGNGTQSYEYLPYSQASIIRHLTDHGCGNGYPGRHIFRIDQEIIPGICNVTHTA